MKKTLKVFAASLFVATMLASCGTNSSSSATSSGSTSSGGSTNAVIKLGNSGPLTGPYAIYGTGVENAVNLAVEEINAKGGLKFEYTAKDDQGDGEVAAQNFNTLYEKGMQVSLAGVTSGACVGFANADEDKEVFMLTPSATGDAVPKAGVYQMCFSDSGQGTAAAKYVKQYYSDKKVGVLYNSTQDYSKGIYTNFVAELGASNIAATASFTDDLTASLDAQVQKLKDCDLIFLPIYYTPATTFINAAKGKVNKDAIYFGADGLDGIDGVEGFDVNSFTQKISMLSHFNSAGTDEATKAFVAAYNAKYDPASLNQFGAAAYDCVYAIYDMLTEAIKEGKTVDSNTKAKDIKAILEAKIANYTFSGVTGTGIKWNADRTVSKTPLEYEINPNRVKA